MLSQILQSGTEKIVVLADGTASVVEDEYRDAAMQAARFLRLRPSYRQGSITLAADDSSTAALVLVPELNAA